MSELITDDWKLKAQTVVKLYRKNSNTFVSLSFNIFILVLGGVTDCAPRYVPWKNTAVLGSTVTVRSLLPQPVGLLA